MQLGLKDTQCFYCGAKGTLIHCSKCYQARYCTKHCQRADRSRHQDKCEEIVDAYDTFREASDHLFYTQKVPKAAGGHYSRFADTHEFLGTKLILMDAMLQTYGTTNGYKDIVQSVLNHALHLMKDDREDGVGVRCMIPSLHIRLGNDEKAYDFIKWYATTSCDPAYSWDDLKAPFLNIKGTDVFENIPQTMVEGLPPQEPSFYGNVEASQHLSHAKSVMLIKIRVYQNLQRLKWAGIVLRGIFPEEIVTLVLEELSGSVLSERDDVLRSDPETMGTLLRTTKEQIRELYRIIDQKYPRFWALLLDNPEVTMLPNPDLSTRLSVEGTTIMFGYTYAAWYETPGAMEIIRTLRGPDAETTAMQYQVEESFQANYFIPIPYPV